MKNLFSKSLMVAAAALTLVSCSNEEEVPVNPYEGKTSDVTVVMSIAGVGSKSSASEVNMDGGVQDITNAVIVPMVGDAYQTPIVFETISSGTEKKVKTLPQTVDRFRVYGNATECTADETKVFTKDNLKFEAGTVTQINAENFYAPHGLYYYLDTQTGGYKAANNTDWDAVNWTSVTPNSDPIGENNCVKIDGVKYAVGVLAAAVKNGDEATIFYGNETDATNKRNGNTWQEGDGAIEISGILVYGQAQSFDDSFTASGEVNVYEEVADGKAAINDANAVNDGSRATGNLYCVVSPTAANTVSLNIEFKAVKYFYLANGTTLIKPNDKIYLPVVLDKELAINKGAAEIFEAAKATFLNATVKNWGLASKTPIESTPVTIGVEIDPSWAEGLLFNLDI